MMTHSETRIAELEARIAELEKENAKLKKENEESVEESTDEDTDEDTDDEDEEKWIVMCSKATFGADKKINGTIVKNTYTFDNYSDAKQEFDNCVKAEETKERYAEIELALESEDNLEGLEIWQCDDFDELQESDDEESTDEDTDDEEEEEEEQECTDESRCEECTHCVRTKVCDMCKCVGGCYEYCPYVCECVGGP